MRKYALLLLFVLMASTAYADVIWTDETVVPPYTDDVVAISSVITNTSGTHDSIEVVILYDAILPEGSTQGVRASLEEEVATGIWIPIAEQFETINASDSRPTRIIKLQPSSPENPGVDINFDSAGGGRVSVTEGVLPAKTRVVIRLVNSAPLTSITFDGYYTKYNYRN